MQRGERGKDERERVDLPASKLADARRGMRAGCGPLPGRETRGFLAGRRPQWPLYIGGPKATRSCRISALQFSGQTEATDVVENKPAVVKLGKAKRLFRMNMLDVIRKEANLNSRQSAVNSIGYWPQLLSPGMRLRAAGG